MSEQKQPQCGTVATEHDQTDAGHDRVNGAEAGPERMMEGMVEKLRDSEINVAGGDLPLPCMGYEGLTAAQVVHRMEVGGEDHSEALIGRANEVFREAEGLLDQVWKYLEGQHMHAHGIRVVGEDGNGNLLLDQVTQPDTNELERQSVADARQFLSDARSNLQAANLRIRQAIRQELLY